MRRRFLARASAESHSPKIVYIRGCNNYGHIYALRRRKRGGCRKTQAPQPWPFLALCVLLLLCVPSGFWPEVDPRLRTPISAPIHDRPSLTLFLRPTMLELISRCTGAPAMARLAVFRPLTVQGEPVPAAPPGSDRSDQYLPSRHHRRSRAYQPVVGPLTRLLWTARRLNRCGTPRS